MDVLRHFRNSKGDIDINSSGFQYAIDTLSYIRSSVIKQKFYTVDVAEALPVDMGEAAWKDEIVQNLEFINGGSFYDGDIDTAKGNGRLANVDSALAPIRMPTKVWAKSASWTIVEIATAASASNWDVVESRLTALKKNWDLGLQEVAFLGHPTITAMTGLLNDSEISINTSLIPVSLSEMTAEQLSTFIAGVIAEYWNNSNQTARPNTFIMPMDDYLGLTTPFSSTVPLNSRLEYLQKAFSVATNEPQFKIIPVAYAQASINTDRGIDKDRYVLYRKDPDTLSFNVPVDISVLQPNTANNFMFQQPALGQYSGTLINRKAEVLYIDKTAVST